MCAHHHDTIYHRQTDRQADSQSHPSPIDRFFRSSHPPTRPFLLPTRALTAAGSHIKGLLINLLHHFWPSLLKLPGFLQEFITPIVKASTSTRLANLAEQGREG